MKIVFVSHNYPPVIDGVGDHTYFLAKALRKHGHEVYVICPAKQEIIEYQHSFTFPIVKRWNYKGYHTALKKIKEIQPDWTVIPYVPYAFNKWGTPIGLPFFVYSLRGCGLKICINFHEVKIRYTWTSKKSYVIGAIQRMIAYSMCRFSNLFVTSIEFYRNYLLKYTDKPIAVIPIPPNYDTDVPYIKEEISKIRKLIAPNEEKIIATYGVRDLPTIAAIFALLKEYLPNSKLLFCGKLRNANVFGELQQHMYITGYLEQQQITTYLSAADVFYIPDPVDEKGRGGSCNKSGSLAAALVAGIPVVGTLGDLNNELLLKSKQVVLTDIRDKTATVQAIIKLLDKSKEQAADDIWHSRLNWNVVAYEIAAFLSDKPDGADNG